MAKGNPCITALVQLVVRNLYSYLQNRVVLSSGEEREFEKIKSSLYTIQSVIESAEECPQKDDALVDWLQKLKDAAYDLYDVLDECTTEDLRRKVEALNSSSVRDPVTNKVRKFDYALSIDPVLNHKMMTKKLKEIRKRLESIEEQSHKFQLSERVQKWENEFKEHRQTHSFVHESKVYGRQEDKEKIVNLLLCAVAGHEDENVSVIPIVGIGGLGKTTLAQLIFNDDRVNKHFELKMWVCVSNDFDVRMLMKKIIDRATRSSISDGSDLEELQHRVWEALNGRRFLLVLDDVWNEELEKWNRLSVLLMRGGRGSRIVVTTRSPMIASIMSRIEPHHLEGLLEENCWKLFASRAFLNCRENDHPNLVKIAKDIVRKCRGLPLAVITLGGLLSFKKEESEWVFVRDSELWDLTDAEGVHGILPALRLSYYHLKPHLRQCFAFCAIFPKDYCMDKEFLIQLWMAHGCVPSKRGVELEDIGIEIMNELLTRSLFQEVKVQKEKFHLYERWITVKVHVKIKVHDLVHDLAQSIMGNDCCIIERGKGKSVNNSKRVRHLSFHSPVTPLEYSSYEAPSLRTLLAPTDDYGGPLDMANFKFLRALDLKNIPYRSQLTSLGELIHLRYLGLGSDIRETLPESISSLLNLQALKLYACRYLLELPKGTRNLINLRCLDIDQCGLSHMPAEMGKLSCLQKLTLFVVGDSASVCSGIEELQCLNYLRGNLRITQLKHVAIPSNAQRANLIGKPDLDSLQLWWHTYDEDKDDDDDALKIKAEEEVLKGLQPHENLKELEITGYKGIKFPSWMRGSLLPSIVKITLKNCRRCKFLPPIGELPSLKFLYIRGLSRVKKIGGEFFGNNMSKGASLQILHIDLCANLKSLEGIGYLSSLRHLVLSGLESLTSLPESMQGLSNLRELGIWDCPQLPSLPEWVENLTALQRLLIRQCPRMVSMPVGLQSLTGLQHLFIQRCYELQTRCVVTGPDFDKIRHIPNVHLFCRSTSTSSVLFHLLARTSTAYNIPKLKFDCLMNIE